MGSAVSKRAGETPSATAITVSFLWRAKNLALQTRIKKGNTLSCQVSWCFGRDTYFGLETSFVRAITKDIAWTDNNVAEYHGQKDRRR